MIKVLYGMKGMGKTKAMVNGANSLAEKKNGVVVFIDDTNQLMYDLKREIRFINVSEFPVAKAPEFLGFLCGVVSANYDIEAVFIDGLTYIVRQDANSLQSFFNNLKDISNRFGIDFHISMSGDPETMPGFIREYAV